jgi:hypothetical protein
MMLRFEGVYNIVCDFTGVLHKGDVGVRRIPLLRVKHSFAHKYTRGNKLSLNPGIVDSTFHHVGRGVRVRYTIGWLR